MSKLTNLEKLKVVSEYLDGEREDLTVEGLKKVVNTKIDLINRKALTDIFSEDLIKKVENTLINSFVRISYPNSKDITYTKLNYVSIGGDEYRFWVEYGYDFCIDIYGDLGGRISYNFSKEDKIISPYCEEFSYNEGSDIESTVYKVFQVIKKEDIYSVLNSIINTIKIYA